MEQATAGNKDKHNLDGGDDRLRMESLPSIDLNLLSGSELIALSHLSSCFSLSSGVEDIGAHKIDRATFNESAGSRKQTYSRLSLGGRHQGNTRVPRTGAMKAEKDPSPRRDKSQIRSVLKSIFSIDSADESDGEDDKVKAEIQPRPVSTSYISKADLATSSCAQVGDGSSSGAKRKPGRPKKNQNPRDSVMIGRQSSESEKDLATSSSAQVGDGSSSGAKRKPGRPKKNQNPSNSVVIERQSSGSEKTWRLNRDGLAVNLEVLRDTEEPYGEELRRRTLGMETEEQLLKFLEGLIGKWGSSRKKTKIVNASEFGDALPKGWKIMLCIKNKAGQSSLACHHYISPNGQEFAKCNQIFLYLLSLDGGQVSTLTPNIAVDNMHNDNDKEKLTHSSEVAVCSGLGENIRLEQDNSSKAVIPEEAFPNPPLERSASESVRDTVFLEKEALIETSTNKNCHEHNVSQSGEQAIISERANSPALELKVSHGAETILPNNRDSINSESQLTHVIDPSITSSQHQGVVTCSWCQKQFRRDGIDHGGQGRAVIFVCINCKAKPTN